MSQRASRNYGGQSHEARVAERRQRLMEAAARLNGLSYSQLINGLKVAGVTLDRKVLADLAVKDPAGFSEVAGKARAAIGSSAPAA